MKEDTTVLSATVLVARILTLQYLVLVRIFYASFQEQKITVTFPSVAEPPKITNQPQDFKDVVPGTPVNFTITTTGTEPLSYQWQWKPAGEEGGSEEWQLCDVEGPQTAVLSIPSVQKSNEGQYRCNISNCAGSQTSNTVTLSLGKKPIDIHHFYESLLNDISNI